MQKDQLTKTPNLKVIKPPHIDTSGNDDLFQVGKAGEYVWATFKEQGHTQQPPEVQETRGHNNKMNDNERQAKLRNVNKGNAATNGSNTKRKVGEAGEDIRAASAC